MDSSHHEAGFRPDLIQTLTDLSLCHPLAGAGLASYGEDSSIYCGPVGDSPVGAAPMLVGAADNIELSVGGRGTALGVDAGGGSGLRDWYHVVRANGVGDYVPADTFAQSSTAVGEMLNSAHHSPSHSLPYGTVVDVSRSPAHHRPLTNVSGLGSTNVDVVTGRTFGCRLTPTVTSSPATAFSHRTASSARNFVGSSGGGVSADNNAHSAARLEEFVANVLDADHVTTVIRPDYERQLVEHQHQPHIGGLDVLSTLCDPVVTGDHHGRLLSSPVTVDDFLGITSNPLFVDTLGASTHSPQQQQQQHLLIGSSGINRLPSSASVGSPTMSASGPVLGCLRPSVPGGLLKSDVTARKKIVAKRKGRTSAGDAGKTVLGTTTNSPSVAPSKPPMLVAPSKPIKPIDDYTKFVNYVPECLERFGFCVVDKFAGRTFGTAVMNEVCGLYELGAFEEGLLTTQAFASTEVRGDRVFWLEREDSNRLVHICQLLHRLDNLFLRLHGRLGEYHITSRSKAMLACYPGQGRGYRRHVDNPNQDGRVITAIYYLNKSWDPKSDGGVLRMFPALLPDNAVDVEPIFDRVVFFWSDHRTPHEVQPAYRPRYAVTIWYFDDVQRQTARLRYAQQESVDEHPRLASVALTSDSTASQHRTTSSSAMAPMTHS